MDEMIENNSTNATCAYILDVFSVAHMGGYGSTGSKDHALSIVRLEERRGEVLGKMQRFRDQGEALCIAADHLIVVGKQQDSEIYYQRARKIAEAHGFFSVECNACLGLGKLAMVEKRFEDSIELLRNAMAAVPLNEEEEDTCMELNVLQSFTEALFHAHAIDEVEPLVARYREAAVAKSDKDGCLCFCDFHSLYTSSRLHEVLPTCTHPRWEPIHTAGLLLAPRLMAAVTGFTPPEKIRTHSVSIQFSAGTRETSRGRGGSARSAHPHARERCSDARPLRSMPQIAACSMQEPQDSRSGARGAGAHRVGGSQDGQTAPLMANHYHYPEHMPAIWSRRYLVGE